MEAAVKIVTHKVLHALEGHQCVDLDELNGKLVGLVDAINASVPFRCCARAFSNTVVSIG